ncbi:hypothetical protein HYFRA_00010096 [Hymenoscyphus fraxineus]|uniref:Uncharacterized protein n=1 Tax=Hymenoscyphus fraxineus TaxID=746836 RepID=A0A9N9KY61_9HELO|nr:hypothetical protein HYFRA_00010096 [Hymenoscyphus fraxineus]
MLTTIPKNSGLISRVQTYAPCSRAPAPSPVTALPAMKAADEGARAVTREPTMNFSSENNK